jgi:hypothetical protein
MFRRRLSVSGRLSAVDILFTLLGYVSRRTNLLILIRLSGGRLSAGGIYSPCKFFANHISYYFLQGRGNWAKLTFGQVGRV